MSCLWLVISRFECFWVQMTQPWSQALSPLLAFNADKGASLRFTMQMTEVWEVRADRSHCSIMIYLFILNLINFSSRNRKEFNVQRNKPGYSIWLASLTKSSHTSNNWWTIQMSCLATYQEQRQNFSNPERGHFQKAATSNTTSIVIKKQWNCEQIKQAVTSWIDVCPRLPCVRQFTILLCS